jgi:hypothetical protein
MTPKVGTARAAHSSAQTPSTTPDEVARRLAEQNQLITEGTGKAP